MCWSAGERQSLMPVLHATQRSLAIAEVYIHQTLYTGEEKSAYSSRVPLCVCLCVCVCVCHTWYLSITSQQRAGVGCVGMPSNTTAVERLSSGPYVR